MPCGRRTQVVAAPQTLVAGGGPLIAAALLPMLPGAVGVLPILLLYSSNCDESGSRILSGCLFLAHYIL